jgi:hypothetical protein
VGQATAKSVQFENEKPLDLPCPDVLHQTIQLGPGRLGSANFVHVQGEVFPATLAAVAFQLLFLAVGALAIGADPDV